MNLSAADKELMRALLQARNPALLALVDVLGLGLLPVEQREAITRAMGIERRINREKWFARSAEIERLVEYVWTSRPLAPDDAQLLRDAIEREAPSLLPLLNMIGTLELTQDESNALRLAIVIIWCQPASGRRTCRTRGDPAGSTDRLSGALRGRLALTV